MSKKRGLGKNGKPRGVSWRLCKAMELAKTLDTKDLYLSELSEQSKLSKYYLSRQFINLVGCSFQDYKAKRRMDEGIRYLLTTDLSIGEISTCLGFSRQDLFARVFKEATSYTPTEYRMFKALKGNIPEKRI